MDGFQKRVRQARLKMGLSQSVLADMMGVSQPTVANWETGSHTPRHAIIQKIGKVLNVEPMWLLSGDSSQTAQKAQSYLMQPIMHVPVMAWPEPQAPDDSPFSESYDRGQNDSPLKYIPFAGTSGEYQAFEKTNRHTGAAEIFICDTQNLSVQPDNLYLVEQSGKVKARRGKDLNDASPLARVICTQTHYNDSKS